MYNGESLLRTILQVYQKLKFIYLYFNVYLFLLNLNHFVQTMLTDS